MQGQQFKLADRGYISHGRDVEVEGSAQTRARGSRWSQTVETATGTCTASGVDDIQIRWRSHADRQNQGCVINGWRLDATQPQQGALLVTAARIVTSQRGYSFASAGVVSVGRVSGQRGVSRALQPEWAANDREGASRGVVTHHGIHQPPDVAAPQPHCRSCNRITGKCCQRSRVSCGAACAALPCESARCHAIAHI